MDLRDSENDGADVGAPEEPRAEETIEADLPGPETDPAAFVESVAERLEHDPDAAGDAVGDLLAIAREHEDATRVAAGEALDAVGRRQPRAFEVWSDVLADAAEDADDEVAFFATRALAQLAAASPRAAAKGLEAALGQLGAPSPDLRQAALSVVAEVGPEAPDAVRRADRPVAAALAAEDPGVRTAAAIAAGRVLEADPGGFPRTATALVEALGDDDERVHEFVVLALANLARTHPSNVPEKQRVIAAIAAATDEDLGLRRGTLGEALAALVEHTFEES